MENIHKITRLNTIVTKTDDLQLVFLVSVTVSLSVPSFLFQFPFQFPFQFLQKRTIYGEGPAERCRPP